MQMLKRKTGKRRWRAKASATAWLFASGSKKRTHTRSCHEQSQCWGRFGSILFNSDTETSPGFFCCLVMSPQGKGVGAAWLFGTELPLGSCCANTTRQMGPAWSQIPATSHSISNPDVREKNPHCWGLQKRKGDSGTVWKIKSRIRTIKWRQQSCVWVGAYGKIW